MTSGSVATSAPSSRSSAAVRSTGVPVGRSTTTWNSDLLSNGSIFSTTSFTPASETEPRISASTAIASSRRLRAACAAVTNRPSARAKKRSSRPAPACGAACAAGAAAPFSSLRASQGVTMKAIASEMSMPMLALIGIGLM